ncbi:NCAM [Mytilus coruscus]|uniref:NCAM n=1 Tax=Mytilus coruscus TaxID=42192 RepID=A0A6J8B2P5_MYTCO|nr:NCAM [Mytilus coruscus]
MEGSTAVLQCPVQPVLFWTDREERTIYSINQTLNDGVSDRIEITEDYRLVIENLNLMDARTYRCEGINAEGRLTVFDIRLDIIREPKNMKIQNLNNITEVFANEGERFNLTCTVDSGLPAETLQWLWNQRIVAVGGPASLIYYFTPTRSNDREKFTCIALSDVTNTTLKMTVGLHLYFKPKVHVYAYPSTNIQEGNQLNISCKYESNVEHDDVYWYKSSYELFNVSLNGSFNLFIPNVSKEDRGEYFCQVNNRAGKDVASIAISVNFLPMIHGHHRNNYTTQLREAIHIMLKIESYPEPSVSWAKSAGGKLGVWNISRNNDFPLFSSMYYLESSIQPTKEEHFGLYMATIRNEIGSIEVFLQLQNDRYGVTVEPRQTICVASSSIYITCSNLNVNNRTWDITWKHYFHGELVQTLKGELHNQIAMLSISHCDYRDGGKYVCEWMSDDTTLSGWSSVAILGPPVISQQTVSFQDELVFISVDFYCDGDTFEIDWYINDVRLNANDKEYQVLREWSNISVQVHTHTIYIKGFKTKLHFNKKNISNINKINCQVRQNSYSSEVVIGKEDLAENVDTVMSDMTETTIYQDVTIFTIPTDNSEKVISSLYMSIPLTTAFILILVNGLVYLFWKFRKGKENIPQPIDMRNREPVNIPVPIGELNILNEDHYDEISSDIGSTYYHSVEWLNTTIDSDTDNSRCQSSISEGASADIKTVDNVYEGLDILFIEPLHQYSDCANMKRITI